MKRTLLLVACLAALTACSSDSSLPNPTGKGAVRMINAVPGSPPVSFLIEERFLSSVDYKGSSSPVLYDDFSYTFNFRIAEPGATSATRIGSRTITVEKDRDHIFMLSGDVANPDITVWDGDIRTFDAADTVFEARFSHGGTALGDIDIYLDPAGTVPGTNPPAASLSLGQISAPIDYENGDYVLTVTAANDVNTVYFATGDTNLPARFAHVVTVFDGDANDTGTVAVRSMTSSGNSLVFDDISNPPTVRFIHTAFDVGAVDVYDDEQLTNLVAANVPFRGATSDLDSTADVTTYYFTPAGSTAQILFDQEIPAQTPATLSNVYIVDLSTGLAAVQLVPDRAPHTTSAKLSIYHGAANYSRFDAYLVERGAELTDESRLILFGVAFSRLSLVVELLEGSYDLYLTDNGTRDAISPAFPIDLVNGSVFELIAVDTVDTAVIELVDISVP